MTFPLSISWCSTSGTLKNCSAYSFFWEWCSFSPGFLFYNSQCWLLSPWETALIHLMIKWPFLEILSISGKIGLIVEYYFLKFSLPSLYSSKFVYFDILSQVSSTRTFLLLGCTNAIRFCCPSASIFSSSVWFLVNYWAKSSALFYCIVGPIS